MDSLLQGRNDRETSTLQIVLLWLVGCLADAISRQIQFA